MSSEAVDVVIVGGGIVGLATAHSAKATMAKRGSESMYAFAREHGIAVEHCGKAIVATSEGELEALARLEQRAADNGLEA